MVSVKFYDSVEDSLFKFAVIIAKADGKWVFCKHKERDTFELAGGHREVNETILETASRELKEETGAEEFEIKPVCVYSVTGKTRVVNEENVETFGMLFVADIFSFGRIKSEIEKIILSDTLITEWTYPSIQPKLIEEARKRGYVR
ncbi:NUDIX hydrolase [Amedibacterium intestinale]|uniref:NUDIX hydrolase n=1 Tax=Amedibacterium intestinale TaxID=2583452 RepID=UPI000E55620E|nr:NUDIX domain-containing protein [Amedibacterium intestinale]RHO34363.1 NUDIX domain-containing protein [Erysipelotrichaceae bacterium AM17-60]